MDRNTPQLASAVSAPSITTALAARLDFASGPIYVWTGVGSIVAPALSGDPLLDNATFDAISHDVIDIGENTYSMTGSNEMTITLNVSGSPDIQIAAASVYPSEYQARSAVIWHAIKIDTANPLDKPVWIFRRLRTGSMDKIEIQNDATSHRFTLTIESHAGRISNATNQTYLDQKRYDANDTSQDYAVSIANGDPAPTRASSPTTPQIGYGGGYGGSYRYGQDYDY